MNGLTREEILAHSGETEEDCIEPVTAIEEGEEVDISNIDEYLREFFQAYPPLDSEENIFIVIKALDKLLYPHETETENGILQWLNGVKGKLHEAVLINKLFFILKDNFEIIPPHSLRKPEPQRKEGQKYYWELCQEMKDSERVKKLDGIVFTKKYLEAMERKKTGHGKNKWPRR